MGGRGRRGRNAGCGRRGYRDKLVHARQPPTFSKQQGYGTPHKQEGNKDMDMEAGGTATRKHTGSIATIGTCVTHVVLMCHGGIQARHAHKNATGLDIRKIVTGETTRAMCKQDTMFASKRKTHTSWPPTRGHTKLDN